MAAALIPNGQLRDLSPLKGLPLTSLNCWGTKVASLSPLKDTKLTSLDCGLTTISDLSPLKDLKLTYLHCVTTRVSDLSPLKEMKLTFLDCFGSPVSDLSPLKGMPLTHLNWGTKVTDLAAASRRAAPEGTQLRPQVATGLRDSASHQDSGKNQRKTGGRVLEGNRHRTTTQVTAA